MSSLDLKWSKYIPTKPFAKQAAFLALPHREALYGGAAAGGKSEALLMCALQYFDCPGYKGLVIRRSLTDLKLPESLLSRAKVWLSPWIKSKDVRYVSNEHTFYSREGGTLSFGYLQAQDSEYRYAGAEFDCVIFDELTQFLKEPYTFLFSRIRRKKNSHIPLRMRAGTNPGNRGALWVKERFQIEKDVDGEFKGFDAKRPFIQAKVWDNPFVDAEEYIESLGNLSPIVREQLLNGDWDSTEESIFKPQWFEYRWTKKGDYYHLPGPHGEVVHQNELLIFCTIDPAASEKDGIENRVFFRNQMPSWSAITIWGMTPTFNMILLDVHRIQDEVPKVVDRTVMVHHIWHPTLTIIESNTANRGFLQMVRATGILISPRPAVTDKISRAVAAQVRAENGRVYLPAQALWLRRFEDELFLWTGTRGETADQIDCFSMASLYVQQKACGREIDKTLVGGRHTSYPTSTGLLEPHRGSGQVASHLKRTGLLPTSRGRSIFQNYAR
jgi:predicted phage terminase large subunit-like protein